VFEQLFGAHRRAVRAGQALQHAELLARQGQRDAGAAGPMPRAIDHQVPPLHDGRRAGSAPTQSTDARDQLVKRERLAQVVVRAQFQPVNPIVDVGGRGQHQDAAGRAVPHQPAADPVAVHGRQVTIEHDHVVGGTGCALQGRRSVVDHIDGEPGVAQALADPVRQDHVILHDQDSHRLILHQRR
jgi:hypothetical protein